MDTSGRDRSELAKCAEYEIYGKLYYKLKQRKRAQGTFRKLRGIHRFREGKSGQTEHERAERSKKLFHQGISFL
jgi:hypothetical protein